MDFAETLWKIFPWVIGRQAENFRSPLCITNFMALTISLNEKTMHFRRCRSCRLWSKEAEEKIASSNTIMGQKAFY